jgi:hypothetical protein
MKNSRDGLPPEPGDRLCLAISGEHQVAGGQRLHGSLAVRDQDMGTGGEAYDEENVGAAADAAAYGGVGMPGDVGAADRGIKSDDSKGGGATGTSVQVELRVVCCVNCDFGYRQPILNIDVVGRSDNRRIAALRGVKVVHRAREVKVVGADDDVGQFECALAAGKREAIGCPD